MRNIKFRAWLEEEKRFIYPTELTIYETVCYVYDAEADYTFQIEPEHLQQYTGFKDNNGKELYKGDIAELVDNNQALNAPFEIYWYSSGWHAKTQIHVTALTPLFAENIRVIGNLYENPELLEVER